MRQAGLPALLFLLAFLVFSAGSAMAQHAPAVQRVVDRARTESGGSAWTALRGLHEIGSDNGAPYERWIDAVRYGDRMETMPTASSKATRGYNGYGAWWLPVRPREETGPDRVVLARARSEAYFAGYGYYFTGRFDLRSGSVGVREDGGRRFTVIWIQPAGGEARDLWFDQRTGLLAKMIERQGPRPRTVELSDYRRVGKLLMPFRQVTYGGGLARPSERILTRVETLSPDRALFSLPRDRLIRDAGL